MSRGPLIVMKFGGTSVADPERIQRAAERAIAARRRGAQVVVVVSAPGTMTDELLELGLPRLEFMPRSGERVPLALCISQLAPRRNGCGESTEVLVADKGI